MRTLKLVNGDLSFDVLGRLRMITDNEMIIQSLENRLKTYMGELFYNDGYGMPKIKGKITEESLLIFVKEALLDDTRVFDISIDNFEITSSGQVNAKILIQLEDETATLDTIF